MLVVNGWLHIRYGRIQKRNLGDELNYYLLKELTGKFIVGYYDIPHMCKYLDLLFIGSLVEDFTTPNTIIWGSGAIAGGEKKICHRPKKVLAVRGKLTRQYLLNNGVDCPEVYGDPALLTPFIYRPQIKKKYEIGIIPHVDDLQHQAVKHLEELGVHLIRLDEYKHWHDVIDEICMCRMIVSSSLHGLILSDAYGVPNVWATLTGNLLGGTFKFRDYFSAVDRKNREPIILSINTSIVEIAQKGKEYVPIKYDPKQLIDSAPWPVKLNYSLTEYK